jgi:hypothetical protein
MPLAPRSSPPPAATGRSALLFAQLTGRKGPAPGLVRDRRGGGDRRAHSPWSLVYGGFRPRRRVGRRTGDEHRIYLDWHEPRVLYLALAIVLMSCADALFTLNLLAAGGEELNGVMRFLLDHDTRAFLWTKIALTGLGIVVLATASRRRLVGRLPVMWCLRLLFVAYLALIAWEIYLLGWHATSAGDGAVESLRRWAAG